MGKRKQLVESHDKQERKRQRHELGTLQSLTIQPSTVTRYEKAFKYFLAFLTHQKLSLGSTKEQIDSQAQDCLEHLWQEGEGVSLAADVLSSLQHFQPSLKRRLTGLLRTWQRREIPARAPTLTWTIMEILLGYFHGINPQVSLGLGLAFFTSPFLGQENCSVYNLVILLPHQTLVLLFCTSVKLRRLPEILMQARSRAMMQPLFGF